MGDYKKSATLGWIFGLVVFFSFFTPSYMYAVDITSIADDLEIIDINQQDYFAIEGKYQQVPRFQIFDDLGYETTEYVTPSGQAGYEIIVYDKNSIKHIGYGPEADARTWDYVPDVLRASTTDIGG